MENLQLSHRHLIAIARRQGNPKLHHEKAFLMHLFGSTTTVDVFEVLISWLPYAKRKDGSIYKSDVELAEETGLSPKTVERARKFLKDKVFDVYIQKANGAPTSHYRFNLKKFLSFVAKKLKTQVKRVREWIEGETEQKEKKEVVERAKSSMQASQKESGQPSLLELDKLAESLTVTYYSEKTSEDENTEAATNTEGDVVVSDLEKEIDEFHLQLGTAHSEIRSWIDKYGLEKIRELAERAVKDGKIGSKGGWVRRGLENSYQWREKALEKSDGDRYTTGRYAAFIKS